MTKTLLDKFIESSNFSFEVDVFYKNGKLRERRGYGASFSIDEILTDLEKNRYYYYKIALINKNI